MINAKQLRIGNWIERLDGSQFQITPKDILRISEMPENLTPNPIPLTPEVLEACGFVQDRNGYALEDIMSVSLSVTKNGEFLVCFKDLPTGLIVHHLHTLQNVYFDLCGQELEYKNK